MCVCVCVCVKGLQADNLPAWVTMEVKRGLGKGKILPEALTALSTGSKQKYGHGFYVRLTRALQPCPLFPTTRTEGRTDAAQHSQQTATRQFKSACSGSF